MAAAIAVGGGPNFVCETPPELAHLTFTNLGSNAAAIFSSNVTQANVTALESSDGNTFPAGSMTVATCPSSGGWQCQ